MRSTSIATGLLFILAWPLHGEDAPKPLYRVTVTWSEPVVGKPKESAASFCDLLSWTRWSKPAPGEGGAARTVQSAACVAVGDPIGNAWETPVEGRGVAATVRAYPAGDKILVEIEAESSALFEDSTGDAPRRATIRLSRTATIAPGDAVKLELEKASDRATHYTVEVRVCPTDGQGN